MKIIPINNYHYLYVIVRYESKKLLTVKDLIYLANSLDIPTFRQRLLKFFPDLVTKIFPNLDSIHKYFTEDEIYSVSRVIKNSPIQISNFLITLFLLNFEVENIKTIIKSKSLNLSYEEISRDVHLITERILERERILKSLIYSNTLLEGLEFFKGTFYYEYLKKAYEYYEHFQSLSFFDILLDYGLVKNTLESFSKLNKSDRKIINEFIKTYVDFYNLKTIIRGKNLGFEEDFLNQVTFLNHSPYQGIIKLENVNEIINYISANPNQSNYFNFKGKKTIEELLTHFRAFYHQKCLTILKKWGKNNLFSITSPFSFLLKKRFLIEDIKFISIGIDYNIRPDDILKRSILCRQIYQ
ncbi:MAG: hypothetical protein EAX96_00665 [Candidatus Lokiarchaeota archaeon]|nr:hypothetical protein [Candidatus Lokiarchaeota archaeon]